ncbi:glycosyltransferase family 2 protein [Acinetobacter vivianii]|uniref:glycosyltransferase family 2 protein n=1 Tax=Acinetobacter vivianii TaxID=1776742 RepID=UPI002DBACBD8|nr:glycosyltransferase [Acinetobacter vivianii]MEB6481021.1 glycosyltransferase [Acinetobacter vivianii]MEB6659305.1 glycosyltransferase [Acinetobacter vivianii]
MLISVVLPAYNAELYLKDAIDSILTQTFTDFELIVLNDGSVDSTEEIILSYQDERIVYVKNEKNLGLIDTLNKGLALAKGKYIARMDADDICVPERFEKQVKFLEKNPDYVICGTSAYRFYNELSDRKPFNVALNDGNIRARLFFNSSFIHPSVMFRSCVVKDHKLSFSHNYKYAEDYFFWMDILKYGKGFNLKDKLLYYRIVATSQTAVGNSNFEKRKEILSNIHKRYLLDNGISVEEQEVELNFYLTNVSWMKLLNLELFDFFYIKKFLQKIVFALEKGGVSDKVIYEEIGRIYFALVYTKRKDIFKNKSLLKNLNFILLWSGGVSFLKDRFFK